MSVYSGQDMTLSISDHQNQTISLFQSLQGVRVTSYTLQHRPTPHIHISDSAWHSYPSQASGRARLIVELEGIQQDDAGDALLQQYAFSGQSFLLRCERLTTLLWESTAHIITFEHQAALRDAIRYRSTLHSSGTVALR